MLIVDINSLNVLSENNRIVILEKINFKFEQGKIYTILGKNGSGKSTLIKSLTALLPDDLYQVNGKVLFNDTDLLNIPNEKLWDIRKNKIRYVFQDVANCLDPLKRIEYYFYLSEEKADNIEDQLDFFLLPSFKKLSGLYPYELSGGMLQRLQIVLALLADPDILILDEPTSGVDYAIINLIMIKLKEFVQKKDKLVLIVTQDINFAIKASNYVSYLSDGTLSTFFKPNEFIASTNIAEKKFIDSYKEVNDAPVKS